MITVEHPAPADDARRTVDHLTFEVHPGRSARLVIVSVPSMLAEGTRARRPVAA